MADSVQRYSTEIGDRPDYFKFRRRYSEEPRFFNLFYPNQDNMILKTAHCAAIGGFVGIFKGIVEVTNITPILSFKTVRAWTLFFKHSTPFMLSGGAYGLTVAFAYQMRKKEDYINHMLGAVSGGLAYGAWFKKGNLGIFSALIGAAGIGMLYHQCSIERPGTCWLDMDKSPATFNLGRSGLLCEIPPGDQDPSKNHKVRYYVP